MTNKTNNRINLVTELSNSIDGATYCELLDLDFEPGLAWDHTFSSYNMVDEILNDELV